MRSAKAVDSRAVCTPVLTLDKEARAKENSLLTDMF